MNRDELKYVNVGNTLRAVDVNHIIALAEEILDDNFSALTYDDFTGFTQSEINAYLLSHGGGGGGVDPAQVIRIIRNQLKGKNGIEVFVENDKTMISLDHFNGGEIDIE